MLEQHRFPFRRNKDLGIFTRNYELQFLKAIFESNLSQSKLKFNCEELRIRY
jgi:hypothetical protein